MAMSLEQCLAQGRCPLIAGDGLKEWVKRGKERDAPGTRMLMCESVRKHLSANINK